MRHDNRNQCHNSLDTVAQSEAPPMASPAIIPAADKTFIDHGSVTVIIEIITKDQVKKERKPRNQGQPMSVAICR